MEEPRDDIIDEDRIEASLVRSTYQAIRPVSVALGILYVAYAILGEWFLADHAKAILQPLRVVSMVTCFLIYRFADGERIPTRTAHPFVTVLIWIALANTAVHFALEPDPIQTTNFMLVLVGSGSVYLSLPWLGLTGTATILSWVGVAYAFGQGDTWGHFAIAMFATSVMAFVIFTVRRRALARLERSLILQEKQSRKLEIAIEEAEAARTAADRASRLKTEFVSNMSHEIRTPMNGIIGMTELTLDSPLSDDQREQLAYVKSSAESLNTLLTGLLDLAKIESDEVEIEIEPVNVRNAVEGLIRPFTAQAEAKKLELHHESDPSIPDSLLADEVRLRLVLFHLLANAIKFTETGKVEVTTRLLEEAPGHVDVSFSVADTGIGIGPDRREEIFDAFSQLDGSSTRRFGGTGIGLTISSKLLAAMGSEIQVDSTPGEGSTFSFVLRMNRLASDRTATIWLVDPNPISRTMLERHLVNRRHTVVTEEDGPQDHIDILVLSCIPEPETEQRYNQCLDKLSPLKPAAVIGLFDHDPQETHRALVDSWVTQPVDLQVFDATLSHLLSRVWSAEKGE